MKRWILTILFLLGGLVGIAQADYVIIIANLGLVKQREEAEAQPPGGVGGMMGEPGGRGLGGPGRGGAPGGGRQGVQGQQGQPRGGGGPGGGGRPGMGGGRQGGQPQQPGGGGRPGGGMQPPGGVGMMGGPGMGGPGMGMMGGPGMGAQGGQGMMGGPGRGAPGGMGMMGGPGMGAQGGMMPGGMGMMGGPGMGMMGGFGVGMGGSDSESAPYFVMTVVETKESLSSAQLRALRNNKPIQINHKWGTSVLQPETGIDIIVMEAGKKVFPSVLKRFLARNQEARKDGGITVDLLLDYSPNPQAGPAKFALEHGMLKEFREGMAEVEKLDPNNPKVKALRKIEKAMAQPITKPDSSAQWKQRLGVRDSRQSDHYVLLHSPGVADAEINSRLKSLEDSYKAFFYWFAFNCDKDGDIAYVPKGKKDALLVPDHRLVSVLTAREEEFKKDHKVFDNAMLVADGFTSRRDNLGVFSSERLDQQYKALSDYCGPQFQIFGRNDLLKNVKSPKAQTKTRREFNIASTLALMMRSLEADSEVATVTHEAPRQLLSAIGLTQRNVVAPEWLQFGMGSFFETGKAAPWGGAGGPNWIYLQEYKERSKRKMAGRMDKPLDALKGVVSDRYFRATNNGQDESALLKARTMAWSLTYFLAHRKLGNDAYGLMRYYRELAKMPRDLDFDDESLLQLFARSFNCLDARAEKVDEAKLTQLAEEWHRFIDLTPLEGEEVVKDIRGRHSELKTGGVGKPADKKEEDDKPIAGDAK